MGNWLSLARQALEDADHAASEHGDIESAIKLAGTAIAYFLIHSGEIDLQEEE